VYKNYRIEEVEINAILSAINEQLTKKCFLDSESFNRSIIRNDVSFRIEVSIGCNNAEIGG
jgi:hypothetical protein